MSAPTYEEMEVKRQEMIASFREIAGAMTRCVKVIEEYTSLSPSNLNKPQDLSLFQNTILPNGQLVSDLLKNNQQFLLLQKEKERKKKEKKPRDPNAPKRPPSAYIFFQNEIRDEIRNSNPGIPYRDLLAVISQKWKDLTDAQRKVYEDAYAKAQVNFVEEDKIYTASKVNTAGAGPSTSTDGVIDPALIAGEEDETDDSDDSDSDDSPEPPTQPLTTAQLPLQINPSTLHAATAPVPHIPNLIPGAVPASLPTGEVKKEKKRKNKDGQAAVADGVDATTDKKKKKKNKE
ncbi:uncharacterized protein L201_005709 [Kwoniella dendrophila CBS 6074]|uniref:HMG box domain-containing protein n=1 Tax=Kwoniella dendrophila CBS 6074 TaxID=1295534 RepID=A0AAX4JZR6_9TREE